MNPLLIVAILMLSTAPLLAQGQRQTVDDNLKVDTRNAVRVIAADKRKTQTYCQILELERQQEDDQEKNNNKKNHKNNKKKNEDKAKALSQKISQLQKQVGPEFVTLDNILKGLDYTSPGGREIALTIQDLNQSCPY